MPSPIHTKENRYEYGGDPAHIGQRVLLWQISGRNNNLLQTTVGTIAKVPEVPGNTSALHDKAGTEYRIPHAASYIIKHVEHSQFYDKSTGQTYVDNMVLRPDIVVTTLHKAVIIALEQPTTLTADISVEHTSEFPEQREPSESLNSSQVAA